MKRYSVVWLIVALCVALLGCPSTAMADDANAMPLEVELDEQMPFDESQSLDMQLDNELDIDPIDIELPEAVQTSPAALNNAAESNSVVSKRLVVYEIIDGEATVVSADRSITKAVILGSVKDCPVKRIAAGAFSGCKKLWSVTVPDSVTVIEESAFLDCPALVEVILPDSVSEIGPDAFKNCVSISHFQLPEGLEEISEGTFENCQIMWKIAIPDSVETIGARAFYECPMLKEFTLPAELTEIGESAFEGCEAMRKLVIPDGVDEIGERVFKDCKKLRKLTLPSGLVSIGRGAFYHCSALPNLKLPSTLESIGPLAFAYCGKMEKLTIPARVGSVGYGAFFGCGKLEEVTLKSGVSQMEAYCFAQCRDLKKVRIPESVEAIGEDAFTIGYSACIDDDGEVHLNKPLSVPKKLNIYCRPDSEAVSYAKEYRIPFVIEKILATSVSIAEGSKAKLYMGQTMQLTAVQKPDNAETTVKWKSSSSAVKVSKNGLLTPKHAGKATITVTTENGKSAKMIVRVVDAKRVIIDQGKIVKMKVGEELQLSATVIPSQVTTKLTWKSRNRKVAFVSSDGLVKARKKGSTIITVKTANGREAKIKIKVIE